MNVPGGSAAKRLVLETLGWLLVLAGIAALILPGPGLVMLFAGLVLLSQQYEWAERRVEPVRLAALKGAAQGVESWWKISVSVLAALVVMGFGVLWVLQPEVPGWWPLPDSLWLFGGPWTGVTLILSGILALGLLAWSYRKFRGHPEAVEELEHEIAEAKRQRAERARA